MAGSSEALEEDLPMLAETWGGFHFEGTGPEVRAIFYLSSAEQEETFRRDCARCGLKVLSISAVPAEDWAKAWQENFHPLKVSDRLWVSPPWERAPRSEKEIEIVIDPGQAFGTGHHPTTALMLLALDRLASATPLGAVLDVGCGTGILAIAAAKLGAKRVVALDIDPEAVAAARHNLELNRVSVEVSPQKVETLSGRFDLVMANISAWELRRLAQALTERVAPGGRLFLAGFLEKEIPEMKEVYEERGLEVLEERVREEWGFLALRRPSD